MNEGYCAAERLPVLHTCTVKASGKERGIKRTKSEQVHLSQLKRINFCWGIVEMRRTAGKLFYGRDKVCAVKHLAVRVCVPVCPPCTMKDTWRTQLSACSRLDTKLLDERLLSGIQKSSE